MVFEGGLVMETVGRSHGDGMFTVREIVLEYAGGADVGMTVAWSVCVQFHATVIGSWNV